jgi:hypothetical protein
MSTTSARSTSIRPAAWSRFVTWLHSPPAGADLWAPIAPSVYGYPVRPAGPRTHRASQPIR